MIWAKKIVTYKKYPSDYSDIWIAPLLITKDGIIKAAIDFFGYYVPEEDIYYSSQGYCEFNVNGTPDNFAKILLPAHGSHTFTSFSSTLAEDNSLTMVTGYFGPENFSSFCWRVKFGLLKIDNSNGINGSCVATYDVPLAWEELQDISFKEVEDSVTDLDLNSVDTTSFNLIENGNARWINTFCPVIYQVNKLQNPFRLEIIGENLSALDEYWNYLNVYINDTPVPITTWKSTERIIAKKGDALKNMLPKGVPVCIKVKLVDSQGNLVYNYQSDCFYFTR